jgi:hypothetical protein
VSNPPPSLFPSLLLLKVTQDLSAKTAECEGHACRAEELSARLEAECARHGATRRQVAELEAKLSEVMGAASAMAAAMASASTLATHGSRAGGGQPRRDRGAGSVESVADATVAEAEAKSEAEAGTSLSGLAARLAAAAVPEVAASDKKPVAAQRTWDLGRLSDESAVPRPSAWRDPFGGYEDYGATMEPLTVPHQASDAFPPKVKMLATTGRSEGSASERGGGWQLLWRPSNHQNHQKIGGRLVLQV